jgi:hypothetical protein
MHMEFHILSPNNMVTTGKSGREQFYTQSITNCKYVIHLRHRSNMLINYGHELRSVDFRVLANLITSDKALEKPFYSLDCKKKTTGMPKYKRLAMTAAGCISKVPLESHSVMTITPQQHELRGCYNGTILNLQVPLVLRKSRIITQSVAFLN